MDTISFLSHADLAEYMADKALDGKTVTAVLFYEDAKTLLKELACFEDTTIENVEIHEPIYKGYSKEFYVTIDDTLRIWVDEAYHEVEETGFKGYYRFGGEDVIALIDSEANSLVIKAAAESGYIAEIEVVADACCDCECCEYHNEYITEEFEEGLRDLIEYIFEHFTEE